MVEKTKFEDQPRPGDTDSAAEAGEFMIQGKNIREMTNDELALIMGKFEKQIEERETHFMAGLQEHINFRIISCVVAYEISRRKKSVHTRLDG